jgi:hypothetical protein
VGLQVDLSFQQKSKSLSSKNAPLRITQINLLTLNDSLPLALKSRYATQDFLDQLYGHRNDSGLGVTAVVGASCYGANWLPLLVDCIPQRLVLVLGFPAVRFPEI